MYSKIALVLIGLGVAINTTATQAASPLILADAQMDEITAGLADLRPTRITRNFSRAVVGRTAFLDSGVRNSGDLDSGVFNIKWFVDGEELGYGSHAGVPAGQIVTDGNSQFSWRPDRPSLHRVTFTVDVDNHVQESREFNNSTTITVRAVRRPSRIG